MALDCYSITAPFSIDMPISGTLFESFSFKSGHLIIINYLFAALLACCVILGIMDGFFVCLVGPICFDLVGPRNASQAMGFLLAMISIPIMMGPMIGGEFILFRSYYKFKSVNSMINLHFKECKFKGLSIYHLIGYFNRMRVFMGRRIARKELLLKPSKDFKFFP